MPCSNGAKLTMSDEDTLRKKLQSPDPDERMEALEQLRRTQKHQLLATWVSALHDDDIGVRQVAARALIEIEVKAPDMLAIIATALGDEDVWVCVYTATALGKAGKVAIPVLRQALADESGRVRYFAVKALSMIRDCATVPDLVLLMEDECPDVRWIVAETLGFISDDRAEKSLIAHLYDRELTVWFGAEPVCHAVVGALRRLATPLALAALEQWRRIK